jgi:hypothetical protein
MELTHLTTRTQANINLGDPRHESLGRFDGLRIDGRHLQGQARGAEFFRLATRSQHTVMANALDPAVQHMLHKAAHKLCALQSLQAFAALVSGAH